jgi:hypothetical protein
MQDLEPELYMHERVPEIHGYSGVRSSGNVETIFNGVIRRCSSVWYLSLGATATDGRTTRYYGISGVEDRVTRDGGWFGRWGMLQLVMSSMVGLESPCRIVIGGAHP